MTVWDEMRKAMDELAEAELLRGQTVLESPVGPRVRIAGRVMVCLCANDYLGLADDPEVKSAAAEAIARWGVGAGASRLISGTMTPHVELERVIAEFKGVEDAVVTSTGWMANHAAIHALAGRGDLVLCDKLNHASIIDACLSSGARLRTFPHRDSARLRELLARHRAAHRRCLIVTDSLFSMDGDIAPLRELADLKDRFDAQLLIDEAHATGVFGEHGRGIAELLDVEGRIDATVGTLSKAIGAMGGFVAGRKVLADLIRNTARPYIYTTAPPPAICAAAAKAISIIRSRPERRTRLLAKARRLRDMISKAIPGRCAETEFPTQIIPVMIGAAADALAVSRRLFEKGFLVPAIRPPTVPRGASRLRISLASGHDDDDLRRFAGCLLEAISPVKG